MHLGLCLAGGSRELANVDSGVLRDLGFSSLYVGCYEDDVRWHAENIASFVRKARACKLRVYAVPWGFGKVLEPDPATPSLYADNHPHVLQIDSRGRRCPKACPNNPYFLEWFASNMRSLAWLLETNGFLWDEPSFHSSRSTWSCRCQYCQKLFFASHGSEMPREFNDAVVDFRQKSILIFLLAAAAAIESVDQRLESVVMPAPVLAGRPDMSGSGDWNAISASSACDTLSLFVPWQHNDVPVERALPDLYKEALRHAVRYGKKAALWVAASPNPRDRLIETIHLACRQGVEELVLADFSTLCGHQRFPTFIPQLRQAIAEVSRQTRTA